MTERLATALIYALFTAGGATFVWTVARSIIAFRNSAEMREDRAVGRLEAFEYRCREELHWERTLSSYWCHWAATLEHHLRRSGVEIPEQPPHPVQENKKSR